MSQLKTHFTPVFKVYKSGVTTLGPVTILKKNDDQKYNVAKKIVFYQSLGYTVSI